MIISALVWDIWNIQHITRHSVTIDEVEEVFSSRFVVSKGRFERVVCIGETLSGRILKVVLEERDNYVYYPISAFDAGRRDAQLYMSSKSV
jgi:uncharacterized DUF497 family protein